MDKKKRAKLSRSREYVPKSKGLKSTRVQEHTGTQVRPRKGKRLVYDREIEDMGGWEAREKVKRVDEWVNRFAREGDVLWQVKIVDQPEGGWRQTRIAPVVTLVANEPTDGAPSRLDVARVSLSVVPEDNPKTGVLYLQLCLQVYVPSGRMSKNEVERRIQEFAQRLQRRKVMPITETFGPAEITGGGYSTGVYSWINLGNEPYFQFDNSKAESFLREVFSGISKALEESGFGNFRDNVEMHVATGAWADALARLVDSPSFMKQLWKPGQKPDLSSKEALEDLWKGLTGVVVANAKRADYRRMEGSANENTGIARLAKEFFDPEEQDAIIIEHAKDTIGDSAPPPGGETPPGGRRRWLERILGLISKKLKISLYSFFTRS